MWRTHSLRKGHFMLNAARQLATESAPLQMPKPPPKSNVLRVLKILGLGLPVAASGLLGYALYSEEFRVQLLDNVPYARDLLGNLLPESDKTPAEPTPVLTRTQKPAASISLNKEPTQKVESAANLQTVSGKIDDYRKKDASNEAANQTRSDKIELSVVETPSKRGEEDDKADNAALEDMINKLLASSQTLVTEAVNAQIEAVASIRNHTKLLKQVMDEIADTFDKDAQWEAIANASKEREQALLKASQQVSESKKCVEKLQDVIQEGRANKGTRNNPAIVQASNELNDLVKTLGSVNVQVRQAETEASTIERYMELVEKGRKQLQKEIESLVPAVKLGPGLKLSEDELNTLIVHAYCRVEQLQKQIAILQSQEKEKLQSAIDGQRQQDLKDIEFSIADERKRLQEQYEAQKSKLEMEYLVNLEAEVRKQLARQAAAHSDHLKEVLALQEEQLAAEHNRTLQLKILEQRERLQMEVAGWISRLKGIEAAIEARAANERLTRSAQSLWLACISLSSVINFGPVSDGEQQTSGLRSNVEAILQAGNQNPFVELLANSFPKIALDKGVSTEEQLKERFYRVSRICHRLGLVDKPNSSLYTYMISFLHSLVVFDSVVEASETDEVNLNALDTFALLAHAKYWMDKGNLDLALRFMIQLHGESRRAASDWINDARIFLETKQTAHTLQAFASASGLAKTF